MDTETSRDMSLMVVRGKGKGKSENQKKGFEFMEGVGSLDTGVESDKIAS